MFNQPIRADDKDALEKLKAKAVQLQAKQDEMKKMNKYFKENNSLKGYENLTDEEAAALDKFIWSSFEKKPHPDWQLQNNYKNIRATEKRIKDLERENTRQGENEYNTSEFGFDVYEDKQLMRLQLYFDGKPKEEIRNELKRNGFKWTPSVGCWQRLLNSNARLSLNCLINYMSNQQRKASGMEM